MLTRKMLSITLTLFATASFTVSSGHAQDLLKNAGNLGGRIQEGIKIKPPVLNQETRPNLRFRSDAQAQGRIGNATNLRLSDLGAQLRQRLNVNAQGDLGMSLGGENGLTVSAVQQGQLANDFGLENGDQIIAIGDNWVQNSNDVSTHLTSDLQQNGYAWVYVRRNGNEQWIKLGTEVQAKPTVGIRIKDEGDEVRIIRTEPNSPAARAGLKVNDVIEFVNDRPVSSNAEVISEIRSTEADSQVKFLVNRNGTALMIESDVDIPSNSSTTGGQSMTMTQRIRQSQKGFARLKKEFDVFAGTQADRESPTFQQVQTQINELSSELAVLRNGTQEDMRNARPEIIQEMNEIKANLNSLSVNRTETAKSRIAIMTAQIDQLIERIDASASANASGSVRSNLQDDNK